MVKNQWYFDSQDTPSIQRVNLAFFYNYLATEINLY
jgi:hypothetical protein